MIVIWIICGSVYMVGTYMCLGILCGLGRAPAGLGILLSVTWPLWIGFELLGFAVRRLTRGRR